MRHTLGGCRVWGEMTNPYLSITCCVTWLGWQDLSLELP